MAAIALRELTKVYGDGTVAVDRLTLDIATGHKTGFFCDQRENRRMLAGFCRDKTVLDLSWYGRGVDIIHQQVPSLTINAAAGPATPITVIGVSESKYGFDTGAAASVRLSPLARLYALYDGRFRNGFQSHGGTVGLELRW